MNVDCFLIQVHLKLLPFGDLKTINILLRVLRSPRGNKFSHAPNICIIVLIVYLSKGSLSSKFQCFKTITSPKLGKKINILSEIHCGQKVFPHKTFILQYLESCLSKLHHFLTEFIFYIQCI